MNSDKSTLKVRLVKSLIGKREEHRRILAGLGLRKVNSLVELQNNPSVNGMINKVAYMIKVER